MQQLLQSKLREASYDRNVWMATPEPGSSYEDVLKPEYWAHVAAQFRLHDRIEVIAEDGSYFAELIVVDRDRQWAKVVELRKVNLEPQKSSVSDDGLFEIKYRGSRKWSVLRKSDNAVMQENIGTKDQAMAWVDDHRKALAA